MNVRGSGAVRRHLVRAWQVHQFDDPRDAMTLADVPAPEPGPGQICVRVLAAPANFPDVLMCQGRYGRVTFLP